MLTIRACAKARRRRRIHDLSSSKDTSVNDGIPRDRGALEYAAVDDAIDAMVAQGRGAMLLKEDLADAFRHVPVAMSDWWLLGFQWNFVVYMENYLPLGLRTVLSFSIICKGLTLDTGAYIQVADPTALSG